MLPIGLRAWAAAHPEHRYQVAALNRHGNLGAIIVVFAPFIEVFNYRQVLLKRAVVADGTGKTMAARIFWP